MTHPPINDPKFIEFGKWKNLNVTIDPKKQYITIYRKYADPSPICEWLSTFFGG